MSEALKHSFQTGGLLLGESRKQLVVNCLKQITNPRDHRLACFRGFDNKGATIRRACPPNHKTMIFELVDQTGNSGRVGTYSRGKPTGFRTRLAAAADEHRRLLSPQLKGSEAAIQRRAQVLRN